MKVYRKSHDVVPNLHAIRRKVDELSKLTEEGDGPLQYCGWRHAVHDETVGLADTLDWLILEAANDESEA